MNIDFERGLKEKASLGELVEVCDVALSFIHERTQLFKLLRAYSVCEEFNDIFNSSLERLQDLDRVSDQIQLALRDVMSVKDGAGGIKPIRKNQGRAFIPDGEPAVR
jgi:hypothetical protein